MYIQQGLVTMVEIYVITGCRVFSSAACQGTWLSGFQLLTSTEVCFFIFALTSHSFSAKVSSRDQSFVCVSVEKAELGGMWALLVQAVLIM